MPITMVTEKTGYIPGFTNAGLIFSNNGVIMIDNGWGEKEGKYILDVLNKENLKVLAIINTHTHVDHSGANAYIQRQTGCKAYASKYESFLMEETMFLPFIFNASTNPPKQGLTSIFKPTTCKSEIIEAGTLTIDELEIQIIDLPGHSYGHLGIIYDNVLFCGDAAVNESFMIENSMIYYANPVQQRNTLNYIMNSNFDAYITSHGKHFTDPRTTCILYLKYIDNIERCILEITKEPVTVEKLIANVAHKINIKIETYPLYCTCRIPFIATANALVTEDKLEISFLDSMLVYRYKQ